MRANTGRWGLVLALACGGNTADGQAGESDPSEVDTGLPPSAVLSELSSSEVSMACQQLERVASSRVPAENSEGRCEIEAAIFNATPEDCRAAVADCLAAGSTEGVMADLAFEVECSDGSVDLSRCDATVEEFERCGNDLLTLVDDTLALFRCDNAAEVTVLTALQNNPQTLDPPPTCMTLTAQCPGLVGP